MKPKRASGTRRICHKLSAFTILIDKFGLYTQNLETLSCDKSVKLSDQSNLKGYLKKWKTLCLPLLLCGLATASSCSFSNVSARKCWCCHAEMVSGYQTRWTCGFWCSSNSQLFGDYVEKLRTSHTIYLSSSSCNLIWASTYASYLEPVYLLQKKAIRIITFSPPRNRSKPLFSKLNILSLNSIQFNSLFTLYKIFRKVYIVGK